MSILIHLRYFLFALIVVLLVTLGMGAATDEKNGALKKEQAPAGKQLQLRARPAHAFLDSIGVNTHFAFADSNYVRQFPEIKARLLELGVKHIRDGSTRSAHYRRGETASALFHDLAGHGIRVNLITHVRWTADDILEVLEANRPVLVSIEGQNEPDLYVKGDWAREAREHQKLLWRTVKNSPHAALPVLTPALARPNRYRELGDLSAYGDFGNIHSYNGGRIPIADMDLQFREVSQAAGRLPIIATEAGYHTAISTSKTHLPVSERAAAKYLPRMVLDYFMQGVRRTYLYQFYDHIPPSATDPEANFGLVRYDMSPRPAFESLKNLLALLEDGPGAVTDTTLTMTVSGMTESIRALLLKKTNGEMFLILWQDVPVWNPRTRRDLENPPLPMTIFFETPRTITPYRPGRNSSPQSLSKPNASQITIDVPDDVLVLAIGR
jgi:hypothetical protein